MVYFKVLHRKQRFPVLSSRNQNTEARGSSFVSDSVSKFRLKKSRNRSQNRNSNIPSIGIKRQKLQVSKLESKLSVGRIFVQFSQKGLFKVKISGIGIKNIESILVVLDYHYVAPGRDGSSNNSSSVNFGV